MHRGTAFKDTWWTKGINSSPCTCGYSQRWNTHCLLMWKWCFIISRGETVSSMDTHYTLLLSADLPRFHSEIWREKERETEISRWNDKTSMLVCIFYPTLLFHSCSFRGKHHLFTESIPRLTWLYNVVRMLCVPFLVPKYKLFLPHAR